MTRKIEVDMCNQCPYFVLELGECRKLGKRLVDISSMSEHQKDSYYYNCWVVPIPEDCPLENADDGRTIHRHFSSVTNVTEEHNCSRSHISDTSVYAGGIF